MVPRAYSHFRAKTHAIERAVPVRVPSGAGNGSRMMHKLLNICAIAAEARRPEKYTFGVLKCLSRSFTITCVTAPFWRRVLHGDNVAMTTCDVTTHEQRRLFLAHELRKDVT